MKSKLEYIWLDGYQPTQTLRSKTQVRKDFGGTLEECPVWSFDGSSTQQASGDDSDCLLKPVAIYPDPDRANAYLVMTEVLNADGTPHVSNGRATIDDDDDGLLVRFRTGIFPLGHKDQSSSRLSSWRLPWPSRPLLLLGWRTECVRPRSDRRSYGSMS